MNWQIVALILGVLALLVSFLELLGEIKKKRLLQTLKTEKAGVDIPLLFTSVPLHYFKEPHQKNSTFRGLTPPDAVYKEDLINLFETCSIDQKKALLHYLEAKQLSEMDRTRLSGIWWIFFDMFRHAYASAEHRHPKTVKMEANEATNDFKR